jgi:hypothetical protein
MMTVAELSPNDQAKKQPALFPFGDFSFLQASTARRASAYILIKIAPLSQYIHLKIYYHFNKAMSNVLTLEQGIK